MMMMMMMMCSALELLGSTLIYSVGLDSEKEFDKHIRDESEEWKLM